MPTLTKDRPQGAKAEQTNSSYQFLPPGNINDFQDDKLLYEKLLKLWNYNLIAFTEQAMAGNAWNQENTPPVTNYYNPADTNVPATLVQRAITWNPYPGRFDTYFSSILSPGQLLELGDTGYYTDGQGKPQTFPAITKFPCVEYNGNVFTANGGCGCDGSASTTIPYGPYGPRGWQDEYCEWSVTRDNSGNITRIDYTCENPEYWNTLWLVDPKKVLTLYRETLGKPQIKLEDLWLTDSKGKPVYDPGTGMPVYNPLNKWNSGPFSTSTQGGAMHLTATPNTLQTEIGEAASATIIRSYPAGGQIMPAQKNDIACSGGFGQYGRNSDPTIGAEVNQTVSPGFSVTLYNPAGLYMQVPQGQDLNNYFSVTGVTDVTPYFNITRKGEGATIGGTPYQMTLHLTVEAPEGMPPLSEMSCGSTGKLQWAGQVTQGLGMAILANAYQTQKQPLFACAMPATTNFAEPLQLFHENIFTAMMAINVPNPVNFPMTLLSNSNYVPPVTEVNNGYKMVMTYVPIGDPGTIDPNNSATWPAVSFDDASITATVSQVNNSLTYAVPGNSYPSACVVLYLSVKVANGTTSGLHGVYIKDVGQNGQGPIMPGLLRVKEKILS